jgi:hypothetical protein
MLLLAGSLLVAAVVTVMFLRGTPSTNRLSSLGPILRAPLYRNTAIFFGPAVVRDNVLEPSLLTNEQTFYSLTVVGSAGLIAPLFTNTQTFHAPQLNQNVTGALLTNAEVFYSPAVGSGMALVAPLHTNSQSFYAPALKLNLTLPLLTNTALFPAAFVSLGSSPGYQLTSPTVSVTSAAGALPEIDLGINSDHYAGYYLDIQRSTTSTKNVTDGSYVTQTLNISHQITPSEVAALAITTTDLAPDGYIDPSGVYYQQYRIRREDGALSQWVEISGTVTAAVATLTTQNGTSKNSLCIVSSATPLHFRGTNGNGACMPVRATVGAVDADFQFEITITALGGTLYFGVDDGLTNFSSGFPRPGYSNAAGVAFEVQATNWINAYWNTASQQRTYQSSGTSMAIGDVFHVSVNQTTGVCQLRRTRGGTTTSYATFTPGIGAAKLEYAWVGWTSGGEADVNFGGSAFTYDNGSGVYA